MTWRQGCICIFLWNWHVRISFILTNITYLPEFKRCLNYLMCCEYYIHLGITSITPSPLRGWRLCLLDHVYYYHHFYHYSYFESGHSHMTRQCLRDSMEIHFFYEVKETSTDLKVHLMKKWTVFWYKQLLLSFSSSETHN